MWRLTFTRAALKQLKAIDKPQRKLIERWVEDNLLSCENPRAVAGGRQLAGTDGGWRYRVGSYRIICRLLDGEMVVEAVRVGHRRDVYRNLPELRRHGLSRVQST